MFSSYENTNEFMFNVTDDEVTDQYAAEVSFPYDSALGVLKVDSNYRWRVSKIDLLIWPLTIIYL